MRIRSDVAFGRLDIRRADGTSPGAVPAWLIDEPEILRQLVWLAEMGGTRYVADHEDDDGYIRVELEVPARARRKSR